MQINYFSMQVVHWVTYDSCLLGRRGRTVNSWRIHPECERDCRGARHDVFKLWHAITVALYHAYSCMCGWGVCPGTGIGPWLSWERSVFSLDVLMLVHLANCMWLLVYLSQCSYYLHCCDGIQKLKLKSFQFILISHLPFLLRSILRTQNLPWKLQTLFPIWLLGYGK